MEKLVQELGPVAVQLAEQREHGRVSPVPGDVPGPDRVVVSGHQRPPGAAYGTPRPAARHDRGGLCTARGAKASLIMGAVVGDEGAAAATTVLPAQRDF